MNKYKALLFDLDGTLCDTDEMIVQTMFAIYKDYKPSKVRTREELYYFSGPPIRDTLAREFPDQDPEEMYDVFKRVSKGFYPKCPTVFAWILVALSSIGLIYALYPFLKPAFPELKKITWLTWPKFLGNLARTFIFMLIFVGLLYLYDAFMSEIFVLIFS